ncbi:hypothetical protein ACQP1W_25055 [Spirillospora sp. CA-255316]
MPDSELDDAEKSLTPDDYTDPRQKAMLNKLERRHREAALTSASANTPPPASPSTPPPAARRRAR